MNRNFMTFYLNIDTTRHMKMLTVWLGALFFSASVWAQVSNEVPYGKSVEEVSEYFLTSSYCADPLGEGDGAVIDPDPRCRLDKFDCQTYVETVLSLARTQNEENFKREMDAIRYFPGEILYQSRLHFSETQWTVENVKRGYFEDLTESLDSCSIQNVIVDSSKWYLAKAKKESEKENPNQNLILEYQNIAKQMAPVSIDFSYLPLTVLDQEFVRAIPSESIILFIKKNSDPSIGATPIMVTHMGFVMDTFAGKVLRHAAYNKEVMDVNLEDYITKFVSKADAATFASVGIKLLKPL